MASTADWLEGARVRTLPASLAPVILASGITLGEGSFSWVRTLLAALVALFLQVGVNFSNDYSDGIRGTDADRTGPTRLTASGLVKPQTVKLMAFVFFGFAAIAGLALVAISGHWWLLAVGAAAIVAAWFYTGGKHPYGYAGLGEVFVMVFFGWVATVGTVYTQSNVAYWYTWVAGTGIGFIACALLMVNNLRDIPTDAATGKKTLAVRMGDKVARWAFIGMLLAALICASALVAVGGLWLVLSLVFLVFAFVIVIRPVQRGASGAALIPVLRDTGLFELAYAILITVSIVIAQS
ncbi:1,4-dihydroxy-2-naphthoate octaprenyltransferase [Arcanobacterium wilhelmae]|uniref:1,4-dihydroxy-2-naphthoate octaprenyltransferase n=1 Tax=Arcanobacterium wilhelmae TaxID=1803177 RepID=A0ABT9NA50_9ACTO|nr:1,4-dihydroxy-2-naphthoate polyprenyltransferase [Arcanobacterium wilhelmae]MDP9800567.1 1,4-dihydroxy-2-naphthoate octaprenyltransferase [Arcanobacterium wilhelmae]WFN89981.1 1,4-dihydroxy-2-naphthoate polyprenyltransferase [Arcanobacterium wilhelmae]